MTGDNFVLHPSLSRLGAHSRFSAPSTVVEQSQSALIPSLRPPVRYMLFMGRYVGV
jgi:hypothetical protein